MGLYVKTETEPASHQTGQECEQWHQCGGHLLECQQFVRQSESQHRQPPHFTVLLIYSEDIGRPCLLAKHKTTPHIGVSREIERSEVK